MPSYSNAKGHTDQQLPSSTKKPTSSPIESDEEILDPYIYVVETYGEDMENLHKPQPPKWTYGPIQKFKRSYMTNDPKPKTSSPSGKCDPAMAIQLRKVVAQHRSEQASLTTQQTSTNHKKFKNNTI